MKHPLYLIVVALLLSSCEFDHGIEPIRSGIQGTVTFSGEWPTSPAEVRLISTTKFPPSDISDLIIGESLPIDVSSFNYTFYLKPATYKVIGVAWRAENSVWDIISICGLYFSGTDSLAPGEVTIATDTSLVKGIDVAVKRSNARKVTNTKIVGTINFEGTWPDSIEEVRVIASTKNPLIKLPTLLDLSFSNSIPLGVDTTDYTINAFPGTYNAVGVIFFKTNHSLSIADIFYSLKIGGVIIKKYVLPEDSTVAGPNFNIKF